MSEILGGLLSLGSVIIGFFKRNSNRRQEEILNCLDCLIDSDPRSSTAADKILENDCFSRLEKEGIPIYLLQHPTELNECKKIITARGLKEGLKIIKEEKTSLVNI